MILKDPINQTLFRRSELRVRAARVGFRHLLTSLGFGPKDIVLLPAYIGVTDREGSGVHDPVRESGAAFDFYKLNKDLSADLEDVTRKIKSPAIKALVVIHYFGILQSDILGLRDLCNIHNVLLIEDCAHCLCSTFGGMKLGEIGDFSFFSIHKILPTMTGGILKSNSGYVLPEISSADKIDDEVLKIYLSSKLSEISELRIRNYRKLSEYLSSISGLTRLFPEIPDGIVPMNFPILIERKDRFETYNMVRERGIEAIALYYRLIDEIKIEDYPISHEISEQILNLPIHQEVKETDLSMMAETMEAVLS